MSGNGDYISREAALKFLCKAACNVPNCECDRVRCPEWFAIHDAPAADVRPVVYCKDCKWYQIDELKKDGTEDRRYNPSVCVLAGQRRDPNHFCADGKKREES